MTSLLDNATKYASAIAIAGERAIARAHAAGVTAYVGCQPDAAPEEIVRLDPDGRRFVVRLIGDDFEVVRELPQTL